MPVLLCVEQSSAMLRLRVRGEGELSRSQCAHCPLRTSFWLTFHFFLQRLDLLLSEISATMSTLELHGIIEADTILRAIDPQTCIHCNTTKPTPSINSLCHDCDLLISSDTSLSFLYGVVLPLYAFWIAFFSRTLSRRFTSADSSQFGYRRGIPGVKAVLPGL